MTALQPDGARFGRRVTDNIVPLVQQLTRSTAELATARRWIGELQQKLADSEEAQYELLCELVEARRQLSQLVHPSTHSDGDMAEADL